MIYKEARESAQSCERSQISVGRSMFSAGESKVFWIMPLRFLGLKDFQAYFLDLSGYFRKFIREYAAIAHSLSNLLKAGVKFNFGTVEDFGTEKNAFIRLKMMLSEKP